MKHASLIGKAAALLAIWMASGAGAARAGTNSGLDLTRPLTSVTYQYQNDYIAPGVLGYARDTDFTLALPHGQFAVNTSLNGQSDLGLQYNYVLTSGGKLRQTVGALGSFASGRASSTNEQQFGGLYQLAYDMNDTASLQLLAKYTIGTGAAQGALRYNTLTVAPYALFTLPENTYAAVIPEYSAYSGDLHATTYDAKLDVGRVFAGHYNVSGFYGVPIGQYSYQNLYRSTYGVKFAVQL